MDKLLSTGFNVGSLPEDYIFPPELRPGNLKIPFNSNIPVIDLNEAQKGDHRTNTIHKIINAAEKFGFFQVINHGISENEMNEVRSVFKELFEMPAEEKQKLCSDDPSKTCKMFTSSVNYETEKVHCGGTILGIHVILWSSGSTSGLKIQLNTDNKYGKLRSAEHRAVTNSRDTRTSAAFFVAPSYECVVEPAQALTHEHNPPIFKSFKYKDFNSYYFAKHGDTDVVLKSSEAQES